jgi:hypothetical protein
MNVRMSPVGVDQVCQAKQLRYRSLVFNEGIDIDYAGNRSVANFSNGKLLNQPICWHLAIGIGIRKPTTLARSSIALQRNLSCESAGTSDTTRIRLDNNPVTLNQVFGDLARLVSGAIRHDYDIARHSLRKTPARFENRSQAPRKKLFFIASWDQDCNMPFCKPHARTHRSILNLSWRSECSN